MIKQFFFFLAVGNACSEYRFEVTPELELLFLKLSLRLLKLSMQSQQTPLHTLHICIYLYLTTEKLFENDLWYKKDLQAQDDDSLCHPAMSTFTGFSQRMTHQKQILGNILGDARKVQYQAETSILVKQFFFRGF